MRAKTEKRRSLRETSPEKCWSSLDYGSPYELICKKRELRETSPSLWNATGSSDDASYCCLSITYRLSRVNFDVNPGDYCLLARFSSIRRDSFRERG